MMENPPPITLANARQVQPWVQIAHPLVCSLAWAPDSNMLAAGDWIRTDSAQSSDGGNGSAPCSIRLHVVGHPEQRTQQLDGHQHTVAALAFHPDGRLLVSASHDQTVRVWDVATGTQCGQLELTRYHLQSLAFSPDGRLLAGGGAPMGSDFWAGAGALVLWDFATGTRQVLRQYDHWVGNVVFRPQGDLLAYYTVNGAVRLWDVAVQVERAMLAGQPGTESVGMHFCDEGLLLLPTDDYESRLELWDWASGAHRLLHRLPYSSRPTAFHPEACLMARIASPDYDRKKHWRKNPGRDDVVELWNWAPSDWATNRPVRVLEPRAGMISNLAFSPDGRVLATVDGQAIRLWSVR